jgi:hypothetical protein
MECIHCYSVRVQSSGYSLQQDGSKTLQYYCPDCCQVFVWDAQPNFPLQAAAATEPLSFMQLLSILIHDSRTLLNSIFQVLNVSS